MYLQSGAGELFQAIFQGEVVSSDLVLIGTYGVYGESAGTSPLGMSCNAAHLVIYEMAEAFQREGKRTLNLGGCDSPDSGLAKFKAYFGATVVELEAAEFETGGVRTKLANAARLLTDRSHGPKKILELFRRAR